MAESFFERWVLSPLADDQQFDIWLVRKLLERSIRSFNRLGRSLVLHVIHCRAVANLHH